MFWSKKNKYENMRRHKRMQADYLMLYKPKDSSDDREPFIANIKDLSASGCRFLTEHFFVEGTDLDISISIPPLNRSIQCTARVMRIRQSERVLYYVGVRFLDLPKRDEEDLELFVEGLAKNKKSSFMVGGARGFKRKQEIQESY